MLYGDQHMMEFIATCTLGLEGAPSKELKNMGYKIVDSESGRIRFLATIEDIPKLNIWMRSAERILITFGRFKAETFDELFEGTFSLPWNNLITREGKISVVKVRSVRSKLFSVSSIQSIVKKAIVEKLSQCYKVKTLPEISPEYPIHVYLKDDIVTIAVDTTGRDGLHKRGYRKRTVKAPLRETIAASLIILARWKNEETLVDPFCGSGTICIEAGMIACNIAPGLRRHFCSENWGIISKNRWKMEKDLAKFCVEKDNEYKIIGSDIDEHALEAAKINAKTAGVRIKFVKSSFEKLKINESIGVIITNPPYGTRLQESIEIHKSLKILKGNFPGWKYNIVSPFKNFEIMFEKRADKKFSFFNSGIKVFFYQFWRSR